MFPWVVLQLTGSYLHLGVSFALTGLPWLVGQPFGGFLADRLARKRILVVSTALTTAVSLVVPLSYYSGVLGLAAVYSALIVKSFLNVFFVTASFAALPTIVADTELDEAYSLLHLTHTER